MSRERSYFVYIMSSKRGVLYIGITNNLERRLSEHRARLTPSFTSRYRIARLLYFEQTDDVQAALEREKELKGWRRDKKLDLIRSMNPDSSDLAPP